MTKKPIYATAALALCAGLFVTTESRFTTHRATDIGKATATLHGQVTSSTGLGAGVFEWGNTPAFGYKSAAIERSIDGQVGLAIKGLACDTTYHYRLTGHPMAIGGSGERQTFTTQPCNQVPIAGFAGPFAPENWAATARPPQGLVVTARAPKSITISNYRSTFADGASFSLPQAPSDATVHFRYSLYGTTDACPASYRVAGRSTVLRHSGGTVAFSVMEGQSIGFALTAKAEAAPCAGSATPVTMVITDFVFTPRG